ncbi:MAG: TolB family protein [Flavobacterium sp.]|nr:TolB family protein [Pedobacter sp.]
MRSISILIFKATFGFLTIMLSSAQTFAQKSIGDFQVSTDIGKVKHPGSASYNQIKQQYELSGSGKNIWGTHDEFHFLYKQIKGDFILHARGTFIGKGTDPHRKFGWMLRSTLDTGSAMVIATVHGDGLTSLQYRNTNNAEAMENKSEIVGPDVVQLERRGNLYIMSVAKFGDPFVAKEITLEGFGDDLYVGLFISSHNAEVVEKVTFDNVRITVPVKAGQVPYRDYLGSRLETMDVQTGNRQVIHTDTGSIQAPNWTNDNKTLIYNKDGLIYFFDLKSKKSKVLNTDFVKENNNDHVLSFDGKMLGLSSSSGDKKYGSLIYTVPIAGGKPKLITPIGPSYLHGWSPDGKYLTFTGQRNDDYDIYKIPSNGGPEIRLTNTPGLDDGSEYSPDGKYIYFNSVRTGFMQLWRMKEDGTEHTQLTFDEYNNWFPHISPDGKMIVFLTFNKDVPAGDHPFYKHVYLRSIPITGGKPKVVAYLYGGQGSINTPSWSPDSKKIAFISNTD